MRTGPTGCPAAGFLTPAAFVVAYLLIYWSGFVVVWKLGIVLVIGYVLIGIGWRSTRSDRRWTGSRRCGCRCGWSAWASSPGRARPYPAEGNTGNIPFWWDMLLVAVFSLVIFYWAMATRLPREEMMYLVDGRRCMARSRRCPATDGAAARPSARQFLPGGPVRCGTGHLLMGLPRGPLAPGVWPGGGDISTRTSSCLAARPFAGWRS